MARLGLKDLIRNVFLHPPEGAGSRSQTSSKPSSCAGEADGTPKSLKRGKNRRIMSEPYEPLDVCLRRGIGFTRQVPDQHGTAPGLLRLPIKEAGWRALRYRDVQPLHFYICRLS